MALIARLMFADSGFDYKKSLSKSQDAVYGDLHLKSIINAMAQGDDLIKKVAQAALLDSLRSTDTVLYRQEILCDAISHPNLFQTIYELTSDALWKVRREIFTYGLASDHDERNLRRGRDLLEFYLPYLERLNFLALQFRPKVQSRGLKTLLDACITEVDKEFLVEARELLQDLKFDRGIHVSACLGAGNMGVDYIPHDAPPSRRGLGDYWQHYRSQHYLVRLAERDEAGAQVIGQMRDRAVGELASVVGESGDRVEGFFRSLRSETAFYLGCVNLYNRMKGLEVKTCLPVVQPMEAMAWHFDSLRDARLVLDETKDVVGNHLSGEQRKLILITGANEGGKSTYLRSLGQAQLMAQCGMFVLANQAELSITNGVFTHYRREEDAELEVGKFEEELRRMSELVEVLSPGSMVLFNESFASTNMIEGSQVAEEVVSELVNAGIRVAFVTHLFHFSTWAQGHFGQDGLYLRAIREANGRRSFELKEGDALPTSFGRDLYREVFETQNRNRRENEYG